VHDGTAHPGDVACGERGERLETLLGSCVAVVLTDPRRTSGAMCHIVHPAPAPSASRHDTRYADAALRAMFGLMLSRGLQPGLCEAYVYGGGNMFPDLYPCLPIGDRNVADVRRSLENAGVRVLHCDVGGTAYRRLAWTIGPDAPAVTSVNV
jgi:chemotaxis protein CheD